MFGLILALVTFTGTVTEGAIRFTKQPPANVYFLKGTEAAIEWVYSVDNKKVELNEVRWRAYSKTTSKIEVLMLEGDDGILKYNPNIPAEYRGRVFKTGTATLVIKNLTSADSTTVSCIITGKLGFSGVSSVELIVIDPAFVLPPVQFAEDGVSITYTCNAIGVPSQNITWWEVTRDKKISPDAEHGINSSVSGSSVLTIKKPLANGYYRCDATVNTKQENIANSYLQMLSPFEADDTNCPKTLYRVAVGDDLTICCPVSGYPPPLVTWKKNGFQQKLENTTLTIDDVKEQDFGVYTCTATNGVTTLGPFNITVMNKIGNLSITTATDGTMDTPAKVEWDLDLTCGGKYYVVELSGNDIHPDFVIGKRNSLEFHYPSLVMRDSSNKPDEVTICVEVTAYCGKEIAGRSPPCNELTIKIKKPKDFKA